MSNIKKIGTKEGLFKGNTSIESVCVPKKFAHECIRCGGNLSIFKKCKECGLKVIVK